MMAERITYQRVVNAAQNLNARFLSRGSSILWVPQRRNGYVAIDRYQGSSCLSTVRVGTTREMYEVLYAAMNALDDVERKG
jgi:hypothetical protein